MKFSIDEQETIIRYDAKAKEWNFYSCVPHHVKMYLQNPSLEGRIEVLTEDKGKPTSIRFKLEKTLVKKDFIKQKRTISQAHIQALKNGRKSVTHMTV